MVEAGDLVRLRGEDGPMYGEVCGVHDNALDVYLIERDGHVWKYTEDWYTVPMESWELHVPVRDKDYLRGYRDLGFRPLGDDTFVKLDEEPDAEIPIGMDLTSDEEEETESDREFIADEGPVFTFARGKFAEETHDCVREYSLWEPATQDEWRVKHFIDYLDTKYCVPQAEELFWAGTNINFLKPPK